mgnify:CR=1 FL=1
MSWKVKIGRLIIVLAFSLYEGGCQSTNLSDSSGANIITTTNSIKDGSLTDWDNRFQVALRGNNAKEISLVLTVMKQPGITSSTELYRIALRLLDSRDVLDPAWIAAFEFLKIADVSVPSDAALIMRSLDKGLGSKDHIIRYNVLMAAIKWPYLNSISEIVMSSIETAIVQSGERNFISAYILSEKQVGDEKALSFLKRVLLKHKEIKLLLK